LARDATLPAPGRGLISGRWAGVLNDRPIGYPNRDISAVAGGRCG
jgi:hypothetical protein